ncbi:MAG: DNA polymerase III subunit delta [Pseudomonadota bacterium]
MKLRPDQLKPHLAKSLMPIYLVCGDEPLQASETCDAIRARARELGYREREVMHVETGFDWNTLLASANSLSLFSERRVMELHMPGGKPGDAGSKALVEYAARPADDAVLLVITGKLDKAALASKWTNALEKAGAVIQVWPVEIKQLPGWIAQRMRGKGMQPSADAVTLLAERVEGNLLACAQEIEKLFLLHGTGAIDAATVSEAVVDSSRFDVYDLADTALRGDAPRAARILAGLRGEGIDPVLVLWALAREIRSLATMAHEVRTGSTADQAMAAHRVWDTRKPLVKQGLQRHKPSTWQTLLRHASQIDRIIKGARPGDAWDELLQLALAMAGVRFCKTGSSPSSSAALSSIPGSG